MPLKEKAKRAVSKKTKDLLPEFQRSEYEETQAQFGAHKYRLEKTGSPTGAAKMKKDHARKRAIHKKETESRSRSGSDGSFLDKRRKLK